MLPLRLALYRKPPEATMEVTRDLCALSRLAAVASSPFLSMVQDLPWLQVSTSR